MNKPWIDQLTTLKACPPAVNWAASYPTLQVAWDSCKRGDWMLWLWEKQVGEPWSDAWRPLVLCACACTRLSLKFVTHGDCRPLARIECAEAWARGEHDDHDKVKAYAIPDAAVYAAAEASDAAYAVAKMVTLETCANIVRKHHPVAPTLEAIDE